jgi:polar amino acid transport system substrate-binding protein
MFTKAALAFLFVGMMTASAVRAEPLRIEIIDSAPLGFLDDSGKPTGFYVELAQEVAAKAGVRATVAIVPLARVLVDLANGKVDATVLLDLPNANGPARSIGRLSDMRIMVWGKKGFAVSSIEELNGKSVGMLRGSTYDERFDADGNIVKQEINSYESGIHMLRAGRMDGLIGPELPLRWEMRRLGVGADEFGEPLAITTRKVAFFLSRKTKDDGLAASLSRAAETVVKEGVPEKLVAKYSR